MSNPAVQLAIVAAALTFAAALTGCVGWQPPARAEAPSIQASVTFPPPAMQAIPAPSVAAPAAQSAERAQSPLISNDSEAFLCRDGSYIRVAYSQARETAMVSLNSAPAITMRRSDEAGQRAYRTESMLLLRSGPRIALTNEGGSVVVRNGDTLGSIAHRLYGDRQYASQIARANSDQIADPNLIYPGQVLRLPQVERQCRRTLREEASYTVVPLAATFDGALRRRSFSPPSRRQPDQQPIAATATDRMRR